MFEYIVEAIPFNHVVYIIRYITKKAQHILFFLAFLTFGLGDGVTGAVLMGTRGISAESNLLAGYLYSTQGPLGFIAAKIWMTLLLLLVVYFLYIRSPDRSYWTINGYLAALSIAGALAVQANIRAIYGLPHMDFMNIILLYVMMVLTFVETGELIDNHLAARSSEKAITFRGMTAKEHASYKRDPEII